MSDPCEHCGVENDPTKARWESIGPFKEYRCTVNGWTVPLLDVREVDGGKVWIAVNGWRAYVATVAEAQSLIPFLADVVASCLGYRAHPREDDDPEVVGPRLMAAVAHESLIPSRLVEITGVAGGEEAA